MPDKIAAKVIRIPEAWAVSIANFKQFHDQSDWDRIGQNMTLASKRLPKVAPLNSRGQPQLSYDGQLSTVIKIYEGWVKPLADLKFCDHASVAMELARIDMALEALPVAKIQQPAPAVQSAPAQSIARTTALVATGTDGLGASFRMIAESQDEYPVDLDEAREWIGYSTKGNAKTALVKDFVEGVDFLLMNNQKQSYGKGGHNAEKIYLTVDCFKQFCMMAGTPRGKQVRLHYLEIEKKFKAAQAALATTSSHNALSKALEGELNLIHTKLDTVIDGTTRFNAWAARADETAKQRHVEVITKMDTISTKPERANFSSKTEKLAIECLVEEFQSRCPITDRIIVEGDGEYLDLDLHHIDGVSSNRSPDNCCPLSKEGHQAFHSNSTDLQMNSQIKAWQVRFQMFLARKETPLLIGLMHEPHRNPTD
jgi:phage anti-repressor protein